MKRSKTFLTKAAMLLIVALFNLTGARAQQTLPYECGFEENQSLDGWSLQNASDDTGIYQGDGIPHSGTLFFGFYQATNAYLVSPTFTDSEWGVSVSFYYRKYQNYSSNAQFQVGYTTDDNATDASTFTYGDVITSSSTSWQEFSNMFPDGTKRIAIKCISSPSYLFLDDFSFNTGTVVIHGDEQFVDEAHVEITSEIEGATILYSTDKGTSWITYEEGGFPLYETTTVIAKATKNGIDSPKVSKLFLKTSDIKDFMWNLRNAPTGGTATTEQALWTNASDGTSTNAKMTLKGTSSHPANEHLGAGGNNNYTGMYYGQTLTFEPINDFVITSIEMTATNNTQGYYLNSYMTLSNATKTRSGNKVTITPQDGSVPVVATFSDEVRVIGVTVHYYPTSSPFVSIEALNKKVNRTSASVTDATLAVVYNRVDKSNNATAVLCDAQGNPASYDWINVSLTNDENKKLQYSLTANTTFAERTAYVKVTADGVSSPVVAIIQAAAIVLANDGDNTNLITEHMGEKCCVILDNRTFSTGKWYTLCLPFDVTIANSPLAGADARKLDTDNTRIEGKTLKLEFTPAEGGILEAGTPYIIRWESGSPIVNPAFVDVTISPDLEDFICDIDESKSVYFKGTYASTTYTAEDKSKLFISNNKFYYVGNGTKIGAQRGYFQLKGFSYDPSSTSTGVKEFGITFDEEDPTGIDNVNVNLNDNESIYNVAGQRLGKMQKGINIVNGKKIFVK